MRPVAQQRDRGLTSPYRAQLAHLLERSPFYRAKLGAAGISGPADAGGLDQIDRLPLTDKHEPARSTLQRRRTRSAPTCAPRESEIVRNYATSGTTGAPSYVPLTGGDLDNLDRRLGLAQLRRVGASAPGQRIVSTYNAGPFVAGAALGFVRRRLGLCHIPVGSGATPTA